MSAWCGGIGAHDPVSESTSRAGHERAMADDDGGAGVVCVGGCGGEGGGAPGGAGEAWCSLVDAAATVRWRWGIRRMRVVVASDVRLGVCLVCWYWRARPCVSLYVEGRTRTRGGGC